MPQNCPTCHKQFANQSRYTLHVRKCKHDLQRTATLHRSIGDLVRQVKRRRTDNGPGDGLSTERGLGSTEVGAFVARGSENISTGDLHDPVAVRKATRRRALPWRYKDFAPSQLRRIPKTMNVFPEEYSGLPQGSSSPLFSQPGPGEDPPPDETQRSYMDSQKNRFGLFRRYHSTRFPTHDPDVGLEDEYFIDDLDVHSTPREDFGLNIPLEILEPYPNFNAFRLGYWQHTRRSTKSEAEFDRLLNILTDPDFKLSDIKGVDFPDIFKKLKGSVAETPETNRDAKRNKDKVSPIRHTENRVSGNGCRDTTVMDKGKARATDADSDIPTLAGKGRVAEQNDGGSTIQNPPTETPIQDSRRINHSGWIRSPVTIDVPCTNRAADPGSKEFEVKPGFVHRNLISVIKEKIEDTDHFARFHTEPYELLFQPDETIPASRVYGELYTSDAFLKAHQEIQNGPGEAGLERVVVALMFASDATQLTKFSTAKLWPLYLAFGNDSKYLRTKSSTGLMAPVAFFEQLPAEFKDHISERLGRSPSDLLMSYCQREYFHAQWGILIDDEFVQAYQDGVKILCGDGVVRLFFPRIFTYSADYPEKVAIATIRNCGLAPCPRCLVKLKDLHNLGKPYDGWTRTKNLRKDDLTRRAKINGSWKRIHKLNQHIAHPKIEGELKSQSLIAIKNAFSKLSELGFDLFQMLVPDLLHELELGVWKTIFIHLMRILEVEDMKLKDELDKRFRMVPSFGRTFRKISSNRSELKKITAHDYENMLQVAIPVFEGLLPKQHNTRLMKLLFILAHWHGLAKLRLHTEATIELLHQTTGELGSCLRDFEKKTCSAYVTRELEREANLRRRRAARSKAATSAAMGKQKSSANMIDAATDSSQSISLTTSENARSSGPAPAATNVGSNELASTPRARKDGSTSRIKSDENSRRLKKLNLDIVKVHFLGDYVAAIRNYGTTDSYSTSTAELMHKTLISKYATIGGRDIEARMARKETLQEYHTRIARKLGRTEADLIERARRQNPRENLVGWAPTLSYSMSSINYVRINIFRFLDGKRGDPAVQDFRGKLTAHLLRRARAKCAASSSSSANDLIRIKDDCIFQHTTVQFNYTTYDIRRKTDIVRLPSHGRANMNIRVLAPDDETQPCTPRSRFLYALVLGVYHAYVIHEGVGPVGYTPQRFDFLWVRWYELGDQSPYSLRSLSFLPIFGSSSFDFIDPEDVIRAVHIVPAFSEGRTGNAERSKTARDSEDWRRYYVGSFSDRDSLMREHWGLGIGHVHAHNKPLHPSPHHQSETAGDEHGGVSSDSDEDIDPDVQKATMYRETELSGVGNTTSIGGGTQLEDDEADWEDVDEDNCELQAEYSLDNRQDDVFSDSSSHQSSDEEIEQVWGNDADLE